MAVLFGAATCVLSIPAFPPFRYRLGFFDVFRFPSALTTLAECLSAVIVHCASTFLHPLAPSRLDQDFFATTGALTSFGAALGTFYRLELRLLRWGGSLLVLPTLPAVLSPTTRGTRTVLLLRFPLFSAPHIDPKPRRFISAPLQG